MSKFCYLPQNAKKLYNLRQLEKKQRKGLLTQEGFFQLIELKRQLKIGIQ